MGIPDAVVNIFVERYAAKIGLTLEPGNIEPNAVNVVGADGSISAGSIKFLFLMRTRVAPSSSLRVIVDMPVSSIGFT